MSNDETPSAPRGRRPPPIIEGEATEIGGSAKAAAGNAGARASGWRRYVPVWPSWKPSWKLSWNSSWPSWRLPAFSGAATLGVTTLVAAGVIGAVAAVIVVLAAGALSGRDDERVTVLQTRVARVEQQLKDVIDRAAAPAAPDRAAAGRLDDFATRLGKLEHAPSPAADPALADRVGAADRQIKSVADEVAALKRRADELAAAQRAAPPDMSGADLEGLAARIAALERSQKSVAEAMQRPAAQNDAAARLAFAAEALQSAVVRGAPFAAELTAAKSLAPDAAALAPLESFAQTGVPRAPALAQQLSSLVPALAEAAGAEPKGEGIIGKLRAHAENLVRIRPVNEMPGDDPPTVVARIEIKATRNDLAGALFELDKLPAPARAKAAAWAEQARARLAAVEASRNFVSTALAGLSK